MMNRFKLICFISTFGFLVASPSVQASSGSSQTTETYEEISYEDLVERLSAKKEAYQAPTDDPFLSVQVHAGIGFVNSFSYFRIQGKDYSRYQNGIQLAVGMDLFSPLWFAESSFRNYGLTENGSEQWTLREFDIRIGYKEQISGPWGYRMFTGVANRFFDMKDPVRGISESAQTPSLLVGLGIQAQIHPRLQFGFDINGKNSLIGNTEDRGSFDMVMKLSASM